jgi:hypothetical protein
MTLVMAAGLEGAVVFAPSDFCVPYNSQQ